VDTGLQSGASRRTDDEALLYDDLMVIINDDWQL
jgi:hypothetical protein